MNITSDSWQVSVTMKYYLTTDLTSDPSYIGKVTKKFFKTFDLEDLLLGNFSFEKYFFNGASFLPSEMLITLTFMRIKIQFLTHLLESHSIL